MATEEDVPPLPTRQEELAYLDLLEKSIGEDPIVTLRPKRYSAGPNRHRWRQMTEIRHEYRKTFLKNFITSGLITLPLSI
jgi:predicted metallo-beta-lactamase superfamily hydrolase